MTPIVGFKEIAERDEERDEKKAEIDGVNTAWMKWPLKPNKDHIKFFKELNDDENDVKSVGVILDSDVKG